jgi:uncharacterized membrane protein YfcA
MQNEDTETINVESRQAIASVVAGLLTGTAAGLIGVGGGEFRIPVLVQVLRLPLKVAAAVNLVVGLFTVVVGVLRRWGQHAWTSDDLMMVSVMAIASLAGAVFGCLLRGKLPHRPLKWFVCSYLILVGLWMVYEAITHAEHILLEPSGAARLVLAGVFGFLIAVISGVLGVAGGEMRIPALLYLFAVPIKEAGTLSLMVSVPTVASGAVTDRRMGLIPNVALGIAVLMGTGSVVGVLIGAALLPLVDKHFLKGLLGLILLLATVRLTTAVVPADSNTKADVAEPK